MQQKDNYLFAESNQLRACQVRGYLDLINNGLNATVLQ
jgi:hypothetical protein